VLTSAFVAFGHFLAFFALAAAVVLNLALIAESMNVEVARRIQRADRVAGLSAVLLLVFGTLRVLYFRPVFCGGADIGLPDDLLSALERRARPGHCARVERHRGEAVEARDPLGTGVNRRHPRMRFVDG
jgi:hypothetical protein